MEALKWIEVKEEYNVIRIGKDFFKKNDTGRYRAVS